MLSDKLGVPVSVIRQMPISDYYGHLAYYEIVNEMEEKQRKKASRKSKLK